MPRSNQNTQTNPDVDAPDEVEETVDAPETATETKTKAKAEPKRGELPEGYVTPVGFAKVLTERKLQTAKDGSTDVKPQMVYSYIKNSPKEDRFPLIEVEDSLGHKRQVVKVEDGVAWWTRKNERVASRAASAKEKADKKAANAAARAQASTTEAEGDTEPAAEAE